MFLFVHVYMCLECKMIAGLDSAYQYAYTGAVILSRLCLRLAEAVGASLVYHRHSSNALPMSYVSESTDEM